MHDLVPLTEYGPKNGLDFETSWKGKFLSTYMVSDVGRKRRNNEDSCLFCAPEQEELIRSRGSLFAVADGMGGASAGEHASRMALLSLAQAYYNNTAVFKLTEALEQALIEANEKIFEEAEINPVYSGMGTTVSAMVVHGDWAYIAQVGDSRIYLLREHSGLHQLTLDHSLVAEQVRNGIISEEEAKTHSLKNLITRAVGIKEVVEIDLFALQLRKGDTLMICSDGLCNMVTDQRISTVLQSPDLRKATRTLVNDALEAGGSDNITVLSVRVTDIPPTRDYHPGAEPISIPSISFWTKLKKLFF